MSNCFTYLHVSFLENAPVLEQRKLDAVMQQGAMLDMRVYTQLSETNKAIHPYRLTTEIPRFLVTDRGMTGHALSRPFSGTLETINLDGYACLGLFDFLIHANNRRKPVSMIITVGCITRAVVQTKDATYVFDPHTSNLSLKAAVYECTTVDDTVNIITNFGARGEDFYYDASLVYFVKCAATMALDDLDALVFNEYRDTDISMTVQAPPPQMRSQSPTRQSSSSPTVASADETMQVASDATMEASRGKRSGRKRPMDSKPPIKRKMVTKTPVYFDTAATLPALKLYEEAVDRIEERCSEFIVRAPPGSGWILYSPSGMPFEADFFKERIYYILAQAIDQLSLMGPQPDGVDINKPQAAQRKKAMRESVEAVSGFSQDVDDFVQTLIAHDMDLIELYNNYISKKTSLSYLDTVLAAKMVAVFEKWGPVHAKSVKKWLSTLFSSLKKVKTNALQLYVSSFMQNSPLESNETFICLSSADKHEISESIRANKEDILTRYKGLDDTFQKAMAVIGALGQEPSPSLPSVGAGATVAGKGAKAKSPFVSFSKLPDVSVLDESMRQALKDSAKSRVSEMYGYLSTSFRALANDNHNKIVTGVLPVEDLNSIEAKISMIMQQLPALKDLDVTVDIRWQSLYDNVLFLRDGVHKFAKENVVDEILKLRTEHDAAIKEVDEAMRVDDMLSSIEDMLLDTETVKSEPAVAMIKEQLQELESMDLDDVPDAKQRKQSLVNTIATSQDERDRAYKLVEDMRYDNLTQTVAGMKTSLIMERMLKEEPVFKARFITNVLSILDAAVAKTHDGLTPKDDVFTNITAIINHLPAEEAESGDLYFVRDMVLQMVKKIRAVEAKPDSTLRALTDAVEFFSKNETKLNMIMSIGCGEKVPQIYENVKTKLEQEVLKQREEEWKAKVKGLNVVSAEMLDEVSRSAPTQRVLEQELPKMKESLEKNLETQREKQRQLADKNASSAKKKVTGDLARVSSALRSDTPSTVQLVDVDVVKSMMSQMQDQDTSEILEVFNRDMMASLNEISKKLEEDEKNVLAAIVSGKVREDPKCQEIFSRTKTLHDAVSTILDFHSSLLTAEVTSKMVDVQKDMVFLTKASTGHQKMSDYFNGTKYQKDYADFSAMVDMLERRFRDARNKLMAQCQDLEKRIQSSKHKVNEKDFLISTPDTLTNEEKNRADKLATEAFKRHVKELRVEKESVLKDDVDLAAVKMKAHVELHNSRLQSASARWQELMNKHRLAAPEDVNVDLKKLTDDTVQTVSAIINSAYSNAPYVSSKRTLEWASDLLRDALRELGTHPVQDASEKLNYTAALEKIGVKDTAIQEKINLNAACEKAWSDLQSPGADAGKCIKTIDSCLAQLEPKRIGGGEARYATLKDAANKTKDELAFAKEYEQLTSEYFVLLSSVVNFKYGFDFPMLAKKTQELKTKFAKMAKDKRGTLTDGDDDSLFPDANQQYAVIHPLRFVKGLAAVERRIAQQQAFLDRMVAKQYLVAKTRDEISAVLPAERPKMSKLDEDTRRIILSPTRDEFYQAVDVFGERRVVTKNGTPLGLQLTYGNVVFKLFMYRQAVTPHVDTISLRRITSKHRTLMVNAAITAAIKPNWDRISTFDIKELLQEDSYRTSLTSDVYILANLKLCLYVLTVAWTSSEDEEEPSSRRKHENLKLADFFTLMAAAHPEYIYGILTNPIASSLTYLIRAVDKHHVRAIFTVTENPLPKNLRGVRAYCIERTAWSIMNLKRLLWDSDYMKQVCSEFQVEFTDAGKLLMYSLAVLMLPRDVLQYVWTHFKPSHATHYETLSDYVKFLYEAVHKRWRTANVASSTKQMQSTLEDAVLQKIVLMKEDDVVEDLKTFSETNAVLDYVLGSYVFGIPLTCAIHVSELSSGKRTLVLKGLQNTAYDKDFQNIVKSRNLDFTQALDDTWSGHFLEHSWFVLQNASLRDHLETPLKVSRVPLVVYESDNNTVKWIMYDNRSTVTDDAEAAPEVRIENPFSPLNVDEDRLSDGRDPEFSQLPINTDFLNNAPPELYPSEGGNEDGSQDQFFSPASSPRKACTPPGSVGSERERVYIGLDRTAAPSRSPPKNSVAIDDVDRPVFVRREITSPLPVDEATVIAPEVAETEFEEPPKRTLGNSIAHAIRFLEEAKRRLDELYDTITDTMRKLRIMYLY